MIYPTISEYIEFIKKYKFNNSKLKTLRPVMDDNGQPVMISGDSSVVFKMKDKDTGQLFAIKCFTKDQDGRDENYRKIVDELSNVQSSYLCRIEYMPRVFFVGDENGFERQFPVLKMDWVDGIPLDKYVREHIDSKYSLALVCYQFCRMVAWLLTQPFAQGDLKPDNILVRTDGTLTLVDYDRMYVPAMSGGDVPIRRRIDEFAIASIAFSLKAISLKPSLFDKYGPAEYLLFSVSDYRDLHNNAVLEDLLPLMSDVELARLYALFLLVYSQNNLLSVSLSLFKLKKPDKNMLDEEELSTEVTEEDLDYAIEDEFGVEYSEDGKKLLRVYDRSIIYYKIKKGTKVICDYAFSCCSSLRSIEIPDSVKSIENHAFDECKSLQSIELPDSVTSVGDYAFNECESLQSIELSNSLTSIGNYVFNECKSLKSIDIPNSVTSIKNYAFKGCKSLRSVSLPNVLTSIGIYAFSECESLQSIDIPNLVTCIGNQTFSECKSLKSVDIPNSVTSIGERAFSGCVSLQCIDIPNSVTLIGYGAFWGCDSLQSISLPNLVTSIENYTFTDCASLQSVNIPNSVTCIKNYVFKGCKSLQSVSFSNLVTSIGNYAFSRCESLESIELPKSVTKIGDGAFSGCGSLQSIELPDLDRISNSVFSGCASLQNIELPNSVKCIGDGAFSGCTSLQNIDIPSSVTSIGDYAFEGCKSIKTIIIPDFVTSIGRRAFVRCRSLQKIMIPYATKDKFSKLLYPSYAKKLIEK